MRAFVIAMESEADCVRPFLTKDDRLYLSGIGKVNAARMTQKAIDDGATEILNCGVAGGFDATMKVCDLYEVESAVEYDFDLSEINNTPVGQLNEKDTPYFDMNVTGKYPARILASGDRFTDKIDDSSILRMLGATMRDMEGAAIAHVAEACKIPCRSLKCISDVQGQGAMTEQFRTNLTKALVCLKSAVSSWI